MRKPILKTLLAALTVALLAAALAGAANAQDFYGTGNVLIAVDMAPYAENEAVSYPEGSMGTIVWGEDAPFLESTRSPFRPEYSAPDTPAAPVAAPDYGLRTTYEPGQTVIFPFLRYGADYADEAWLPASAFPAEVFTPEGEAAFLIHPDCVHTENGETMYYFSYELAEGEARASADFLELTCVAAEAHSTVWEYTGRCWSVRTGFDAADYGEATQLSASEIADITDTCEISYVRQAQLYGDPRWEDQNGDCDGKAAYVLVDYSAIERTAGYYSETGTVYLGFDGLVINAAYLPSRMVSDTPESKAYEFAFTLIHELNHYILSGCVGSESWSFWLGEAVANDAAQQVAPENPGEWGFQLGMAGVTPRLRMLPGPVWGSEYEDGYPSFVEMGYGLGPFLLRFIARTVTGSEDAAFWTPLFASQTPDGDIMDPTLDAYLQSTTGGGLNAWTAQFLATVVAEASGGGSPLGESGLPSECRIDPCLYFRDAADVGKYLGTVDMPGAADNVQQLSFAPGAVQGGGTTYAWRREDSAPIAITGAEDRWYFFALELELPDPDAVIEIDSAEELRKIGRDPDHPMGGRYALTADIDLGGEAEPWTPIGSKVRPFLGELDGRGHSITGLWVESVEECSGLFSTLAGYTWIHDLTVSGSVTGGVMTGGIAGSSEGGTIERCISDVAVTGTNVCGGIVGETMFDAVIADCIATGAVSGTDVCGGIAGLVSESRISGCTSSAAVSGADACGGIVGYAEASLISGCASSAAVRGTKNTGGVAGSCYDACVERCGSTGTVNGDINAGGIEGYTQDSETLESWSSGAVAGIRNVGGIVGTACGDCTFRDCYHLGAVTGEARVCGIAGDGWAGVTDIVNCYSYQPGLPLVAEDYEGTVNRSYARAAENGETTLDIRAFSDPASFSGWDFETVWTLENGVRPLLRSAMETLTARFPDLTGGEWFVEAAQYVSLRGILNGTGKGFAPELTFSRAMAAQMLCNLDGAVPTGETTQRFRDVRAGDWFAPAVTWLTETGIAQGRGAAFGPNDPVRREELAALLFRYASGKGHDTGARAALDGFSDAGDVSGWAREAMQWAVAVGLFEGMGDGTLAPGGNATRAQIAVLMQRFCMYFAD